jgi:hypothetical protein
VTHMEARLRATAAVAFGVALSAALAACGGTKSGRSDYVRDADSGAAAPATRLTPDASSRPDSTAGVSQRTGRRGVAGDTLANSPSAVGTGAAPAGGAPSAGGTTGSGSRP